MKTEIEFDTNICQQCDEHTKDYEYFCESCKVEQELKSATEQNSVFLEENLRLTKENIAQKRLSNTLASQLDTFVELHKNQKATIARLQNDNERLKTTNKYLENCKHYKALNDKNTIDKQQERLDSLRFELSELYSKR